MDGWTAAAVLGVSPTASKREIARAFRAQAKSVHPDAAGSQEAFITLRAAFDQLHPSAPEAGPQATRSSWFQTASAPTVNLTDTPAGPRPPSPTRLASPGSSTSGRVFAACLEAALVRN